MQADQSAEKYITKYTIVDGVTDGIWYDGETFKGDNGDGVEHKDFASYNYADDAARQNWGGDWRIPTDAEWRALLDATLYDWTWTADYLGDGSNHAGRIVTRKDGTGLCAGNSIFLPAAGFRDNATLDEAGSYGFYWSSSLVAGTTSYVSYNTWTLQIDHYDSELLSGGWRSLGQSYRPVFSERYPLAASEVSTIDIGRVLAADGAIYADVASADANGGGARAIIAYVGKVPNYFDKFLAIALTDADGSTHMWADAHSAVGTFAGSHAITIAATTYDTNAIGATYYDIVASNQATTSATRTTGVVKGWRLPSVTDWRYVFDGICRQKAGLTLTAKVKSSSTVYSSNSTPTDPLGVLDVMYYYKDGDAEGASSLRAAINDACGNTALQSKHYWNSSEYSNNSSVAWLYGFDYGFFWNNGKTGRGYVRAVFAY